MQPGPDKIIACPNCGALARVFTLLSGNTFRALRWTDGYTFAPMLPPPPPITRCARCRAFYWVKEARVVGEVATWPDEDADECKLRITPPAWLFAPRIRELSADEYLAALAAGAADTVARECELRRLAWWRYNEPSVTSQLAPAVAVWRSLGSDANPPPPHPHGAYPPQPPRI